MATIESATMAYSTQAGAVISFTVDGAETSRRQIDGIAQSFGNLTNVVQSAMRNAVAAVGVTTSVVQIAQVSDQYTKFTAQLRLATESQREYATAYADVRRISTLAQQDLGATGVLYARITSSTRELGLSQQRVSAITEVVNLGLKVSGATAQESASAQLQLSQAFAAGALRGEEFNAVNEAAPAIMEALAEGMGVARGELKQMAEDGKITAQVMADALPRSLAKLRDEAAQIQTIGGAVTVLKNEFLELIGTQAETSGAVAAVTSGIGLLARHLDTLTAAAIGYGTAKLAQTLIAGGAATTASYLKTIDYANAMVAQRTAAVAAAEAEVAATTATTARLAATQAAVVVARQEAIAQLASANATVVSSQAQIAAARSAGALGFALAALKQGEEALANAMRARAAATAELAVLGQQQARISAQVTAATAAQAVAQRSLAAATATGGAASGVAMRALGLLGGPLGMITTVLGLGAAAWAMWGSSAEQAGEQAQSLSEETDVYIAKLDQQIAKLKERNALIASRAIPAGGPANEGDERREKLIAEITRIGARTDISDGIKNELMRAKGAELNELTEKMKAAAVEQEQLNAATRDNRLAEWFAQNGTAAQRLEAELEKLRKQFGTIPPEMEKLVRAKFDQSGVKAINDELEKQQEILNKSAGLSGSFYEDWDRLSRMYRSGALNLEQLTSEQAKLLADQPAVKSNIEAIANGERLAAQFTKDYASAVAKTYDTYHGATVKAIADSEAEAEKNERLAATFGMTALQIEQMDIARAESQLAQRASLGLTADEIANLERLIEAKKRNVAAMTTVAGLDAGSSVAQAEQVLSIMTQLDEVSRSAAEGMAESFGKVGSAIGGLTTALSGYSRNQAAIAAQLAVAMEKAGKDPAKIAKLTAEAARQSAQSQIRSYGDMAGAAKDFFNENSKGYRFMEGVEKTYRAAEMAMAIETMLVKSGLLTSFTSLFVASKTTETAATVASVGPDIAASMAKGTAAAAVGVAGQAQGDPYTAWARMAAMAAVMAGLGFAVAGGRGGGGGITAGDVQKMQGTALRRNPDGSFDASDRTGGVFGDASAKSDSISASIEMLEQHSSALIPINQGMLSALRSIEASMTGLANLVIRTPGLIEGDNFGIQTGQVNIGKPTDFVSRVMTEVTKALFGPGLGNKIASFVNNLWGKTTQNIVDSGLQYSGNLRALQSGAGFGQYASVDTTKSSWFGLSKKTSNSVQTQGLSSDLAQQFALVFSNVEGALKAAAANIGIGGDLVAQALDGLQITEKISLKGLSGDALTSAINSVISKTMDQMAATALPEFDRFRQVGEGYAETVMRVTGNYSHLDASLTAIGTKFGATGMASLAAREDLIALTGGIDALASKTTSFADNFLTEAERLAPVQKHVTDTLAAMGLAHLDSRDAFKDHLLALNPAIEAERQQFAALMDLQAAFAAVHAATVDASKSQQEIADERSNLVERLNDLTMTSAELLDQQRNALDASNRSIFDQIVAAERANAVADERKTLQDQLDQLTMTAAELRDKERSALDESNRAIYDRIQAINDERLAIDAAKTFAADLMGDVDSAFATLQSVVGRQKNEVTETHNAAMKLLDKQITAQNDIVNKHKALASLLTGTLDSMRMQGGEAAARLEAQSQIRAALLIAKAGGVLPDADAIRKSLGIVGQDASSMFATYEEYARDFYTTQNDIAALGKLTDDAVSIEQNTLDLLKDQKTLAEEIYKEEIKRLDEIVSTAATQIAELKGQSTTLLNIEQAIQALTGALTAARANPLAAGAGAITGTYQAVLGRTPDAAGMAFWQGKLAEGVSQDAIDKAIQNSPEAKAQKLYQQVLGRAGDAAGVKFWTEKLAEGVSESAVRAAMYGDKESRVLRGLPPLAVGTNYLPADMPILAHQGERIIPAADNRELMRRLSSPTDNSAALAQELKALREENARMREMMESHLYAIAKNTLNTADHLDGAINGQTPVMTKSEGSA